MSSLLRFWFTLESEVDRRAYLTHGLGLMAAKYGVDASLIGLTTGAFWAPWDYLNSVPLLSTRLAELAPGWLAPVLLVWTLPFLWIGVTLTMRRLLDVGASPWFSLFFFVPFLGYAMMALLAILPGRPGARPEGSRPDAEGDLLPSAVVSAAAGVAVGLGMVFLGVMGLESYGIAVFMGTPFAVGVVTGYLFCSRYPATRMETAVAVLMAALLTSLVAFVIGLEGAICLLMLAPLGIVLSLMGGAVGRAIALTGGRSLEGAFVLLVLPTAAVVEGPVDDARLRDVTTSIEIEAPADVVWERVIAFPELSEPERWMFRLGIAYPMSARIEGSGIGAVRYCVFSTGAFVEPITHWEPGVRLSFDVVESPRPLDELSPYAVDPPHLEGYLVPRRGEFRIVPLAEGRVRLEGTTWYEQRLRPTEYWGVYSDRIIGAIHERVLEHIRRTAEGGHARDEGTTVDTAERP